MLKKKKLDCINGASSTFLMSSVFSKSTLKEISVFRKNGYNLG